MERELRECVARLRPVERVVLDRRRLAGLVDGREAAPCEGNLGAALEELAYWLYHFDAALRRGDSAELSARAMRIAELAAEAGLTTLHRAAANAVAVCGAVAEGAGPKALDRLLPARAAVAARLVRVGEASILSLWDLRDPAP